MILYNTKEAIEWCLNQQRQCGQSKIGFEFYKSAIKAHKNNEETFEFEVGLVEVDVGDLN